MSKKYSAIETVLWLLALISTITMLYVALPYFYSDFQTPYLESLKKESYDNGYLYTVLFIHVAAGTVCFIVGLNQVAPAYFAFSNSLHSKLGPIYIYSLVLSAIPGMIVSVFLPTNIFFILGIECVFVYWLICALKGYVELKKNNYHKHGNYMIRSYVVGMSIVTFRLLSMLNYYIIGMEYSDAFFWSWPSILFNLALAEFIVWLRSRKNKTSSA